MSGVVAYMAPIQGRMAKIDTELHFSFDIANPGNLAGRLESSNFFFQECNSLQFSSYNSMAVFYLTKGRTLTWKA